MSWFGWLTKGDAERSILDGVIFLAELAAVFCVIYVVLCIYEKVRGK